MKSSTLLCSMLLGQQFPGINGFLKTRATLMLDIVFLAMFVIVPVMLYSIYLVRYQRRYRLHKQIQLALGTVLLIAVMAFETEQFLVPWEDRATPSPYFHSDNKWASPVGISLLVHLFFAIPTFFLWIYVMVQACRKFPSNPVPNDYSPKHRLLARLAAFEITMTAITGWVFYYLAFVAT